MDYVEFKLLYDALVQGYLVLPTLHKQKERQWLVT